MFFSFNVNALDDLFSCESSDIGPSKNNIQFSIQFSNEVILSIADRKQKKLLQCEWGLTKKKYNKKSVSRAMALMFSKVSCKSYGKKIDSEIRDNGFLKITKGNIPDSYHAHLHVFKNLQPFKCNINKMKVRKLKSLKIK